MLKITSFIMSVFTVIALMLPAVKYGFKPTVEVNCTKQRYPVKNYATGFLYGLATEGVPSSEMAESINISSASQKTYGGLQHPIGDVNDVSKNLESCDYIVVYLQDCFDSWYYCHEEINSLREKGEYDWEKFLDERFLPNVSEQIENISKTDYADRVVYCLYNECDNAIWFGEKDDEGNLQFNDEGRNNFYKAWEKTYKLVKSINPKAKIGGPGYYEYNIEKLSSFLDYCAENKCVPDIMIYHELQDVSSAFFEDHYEQYRKTEAERYGFELPIIVTEYGCMYECGNAGEMLPYICAMEKTGVYGNVAFWRLSNNLCDTAADNNSPNENWWLYRWYAEMAGHCYTVTNVIDVMHSDVANVVKYERDRFHYVPLNAISTVNYDNDEIAVILGGCDYDSNVIIKNIKDTKLKGEEVDIKVEAVYYKGLSGVISAPVTISEHTQRAGNKLKIKIACTDSSAVYRVTVKKSDGQAKDYQNDNIPVRYEFEHGTRLGDCYTYDSAYATTGEIEGMVGGIEKLGDGVSIKINVPSDGKYQLDIIYGKANDGESPDERVSAKALLLIDGNEEALTLNNTVRSEFTDCLTLVKELKAGEHEISFKHSQGTYVLDSMLVSRYEQEKKIAVLPDVHRSNEKISAFLTVAPSDGFFKLSITPDAEFLLDGISCKADSDGNAIVYMRRGLNYVEVKDKKCNSCVISKSDKELKSYTVSASDMLLSDGAELKKVNDIKYIDGISSEKGSAQFTVNAEKAGNYRMTVTYSNNREGGVHDYNVDLIECYVSAEVNGKASNVWCRNTMSVENFKTVTANVYLNKGENKIILTNNGASKFNNMEAFAPNISQLEFSQACGD